MNRPSYFEVPEMSNKYARGEGFSEAQWNQLGEGVKICAFYLFGLRLVDLNLIQTKISEFSGVSLHQLIKTGCGGAVLVGHRQQTRY